MNFVTLAAFLAISALALMVTRWEEAARSRSRGETKS
jgi:hypothetical protein